MKKNTKKRAIWQYPWRYAEGSVLSLGLLLTGFLLEWFGPQQQVQSIGFPHNMYIGLGIVVVLGGVHILFRRHPVVKWLSGVPAAICAIALFTFLVLLMGLTPQDDTAVPLVISKLGLSHLTRSWPFLLALLFFLSTLGLVALKRAFPLKKKNIGFVLNHAGLWITIFAATLGSGDVKRLVSQTVENGDFVGVATDGEVTYQLPFAIQLIDFKMDTYQPKAGIVDNYFGELRGEGGKNLLMLKKGTNGRLMEWQVEVKHYIPLAEPYDNQFVESQKEGSAPAAFVEAVHWQRNDTLSGWISCGSYRQQPAFLRLTKDFTLIMFPPEARKYSSDVRIADSNGAVSEATIEVNKPLKINGWKIYQLSYDSEKGIWSRVSVFEFVTDPWLPLVYFGIVMMLAGAAYIFWIGKGITEKETIKVEENATNGMD